MACSYGAKYRHSCIPSWHRDALCNGDICSSISLSSKLCWLFSCNQAALQMVQSVCLSVCTYVRLSVHPSVTPLSLCSHHRIIMKFTEIITNDKSDVHAKGQHQRSKVKVTEVKTLLHRFQTVTPVWIHQWLWNDAQGLKYHRRDALMFFKVIRQISRLHRTKHHRYWPKLGVSRL